MTDPFILTCIKDLKRRKIGPPYFCAMPCGKRVWFDLRGRILATSTAQCVRLAHGKRWKKSAQEMTPAEYEKAKKLLLIKN
jgi:hypothetical protein